METEIITLTTGTFGSILAMLLWQLYTRLIKPSKKRVRKEKVSEANAQVVEALKNKIFNAGDYVRKLIVAEIESAAFSQDVEKKELMSPRVAAEIMKAFVCGQSQVPEEQRARILGQLDEIAPSEDSEEPDRAPRG